MQFSLSTSEQAAVQRTLADWDTGKIDRLWHRDASLWTNQDESKWMDWLPVVSQQIAGEAELIKFAADVKQQGFRDVLLLGMGGSSLCPEVLRADLRRDRPAFPSCTFSTRPTLRRFATCGRRSTRPRRCSLSSSKSGSTLEPNIFKQYFFEQRTRMAAQLHRHHRPGLEDAAASPSRTSSARSSTACQASADAIRRCRISAWFRPR